MEKQRVRLELERGETGEENGRNLQDVGQRQQGNDPQVEEGRVKEFQGSCMADMVLYY